jgi:hypothetical protein
VNGAFLLAYPLIVGFDRANKIMPVLVRHLGGQRKVDFTGCAGDMNIVVARL